MSTLLRGRTIGLWLMALLLLVMGTIHFLRPSAFVEIVPPWVPWPWGAVYVSGAFELLLGCGLLIPRLSRLAALGVVALLVAVFPANVYHWLRDVRTAGTLLPSWYHVVRLPLQAVLVGWALWLSRPPKSEA